MLPLGTKVKFTYHGSADSTRYNDIQKAFERLGIDKPEKVGFAPLKAYEPGGQFLILPTEGEIIFTTLVARLNLENSDVMRIRTELDRFMKLLVDKINGSSELTLDDLVSLQDFHESYLSHYVKLAIMAIEKLEIDQFIEYVRGARLAIGSAA